MRSFAVSVVGRDRPGIVAALAEVMLGHGLNVEDSRMTILRGHLAMTLIVSATANVEVESLRGALDRVKQDVGLEAVSLTEVAEAAGDPFEQATHVVSVYGADHPGIVYAVSSALAERGWNITDLVTRLVGEGEGNPLYAMMLEVALGGAGTEELERALEPAARAEAVEVSCRPLEQDVL